jgi:3-hydroxymyristoyl/3-hydroxydecanoyl-(acyl carrier protein) dehydratase
MQLVGSFNVAADHPSLPGHFPGHPVVPGVLLLDLALDLIAAELQCQGLECQGPAGIASVKFTAAVRPGQEIEVRHGPPRNGSVAFACHCDGALALHGTALLRQARDPRPMIGAP